MTESTWKVVMDRHGVTIASDRFHLAAAGAEPEQLEAVVSDLQSAIRGTYGQYCGLARAMEMIGERWMLLIVRGLLTGPKTAGELHRSLPRIPAEVLEKRLRELSRNGLIRPVEQPTADDAPVYELTEYGQALEDSVLALGRWGSMILDPPRPEDIVTTDSLIVALRAAFLRDAAAGRTVSFELRVGEIVVHTTIVDGALEVAEGPLPGADAVIKPGVLLKDMLSRDVTVAAALSGGEVELTGDPKLLDDFVRMFQLPKIPARISV